MGYLSQSPLEAHCKQAAASVAEVAAFRRWPEHIRFAVDAAAVVAGILAAGLALAVRFQSSALHR